MVDFNYLFVTNYLPFLNQQGKTVPAHPTPTLDITISGIRLINPFLLASAPPTANVESIRKAFSLGWAGAVLKTINPSPESIRDSSPRFVALRANKGKIIGFENIELLSRKPLAYWKTTICDLKHEYPDRAVIASIMAPVSRAAWQDLAQELQDTPIDAFELNFSCPHGMPERGMGMAIGTDSKLSANITKWVKTVSRVPVFVKLSPNVTDIAAIASAVKMAGADGLAAINTVQCMMGVDLNTLSPLPSVDGRTTFGGYSGRAVKPIGLRCVAQCKKATGLPIFAMGGISTWHDAAEYLAVGGDAVQVCTEVMLNGYAIIHDFLAGLRNYLVEKGFTSADPLRGAALEKIVTHQEIAGGTRRMPSLADDVCSDCGKCAVICAESGYQAIQRNVKGRWSIAPDICDGCGLCVLVCPTEALSL